MSLLKRFDELMGHLNGEENSLAEEFRKKLQAAERSAEEDSIWRSSLEGGGVDNWDWYSESLHDGGYFKFMGEDDDEEDDDE